MIYTSNTFEDIKKMTHIQFQNIIEGISRKNNLDIKLATITVGGELSHEDFLLHTKKEEKQKVMTMNDALAIQKLLGG